LAFDLNIVQRSSNSSVAVISLGGTGLARATAACSRL
jgi:hypothetical protein